MSSFSECFNERYVLDTVFGPQLFGEAVDVKWFGDSPGLSYYSLLNLILMHFFFLMGLWKTESSLMNFRRLSLLLWQFSIILVATCVTITGLTRITFFWAVLHSLSEWFMIFSMIKLYVRPKAQTTFQVCFFFFGGIYFLIDLLLALTLTDMSAAFFVVAFMGAPVDFSTFIGWIFMFVKKKVRCFPMIAFSFHIVYILLVFFNCLFPPWGRIAGLGLNTMAIFFASMPANQNSWRFSEFIQYLIQDEQAPLEPPLPITRQRSNTMGTATSQHPMIQPNGEQHHDSADEITQGMSDSDSA